MTACQCARGNSIAGVRATRPALFTTMSMPPNRLGDAREGLFHGRLDGDVDSETPEGHIVDGGDVEHHDARARTLEHACRSRADAFRPSGDDRGLSFECEEIHDDRRV